MKEFRVLAAALGMILISLIVSGVRSVVVMSESATFDIYDDSENWWR